LPPPAYGAGTPVDLDVGLRQYMLRVYNFMAAGLGLTGLVAYVAVATGFYQQIAGTPLGWLVMLAPRCCS
jgi:FtsH-binding integral membrane protein